MCIRDSRYGDTYLDSDNNRILYNPEKPGAEYSAEKTFAVKDNAIAVSYTHLDVYKRQL